MASKKILLLLTLLLATCMQTDALFGRKKRREAREAAKLEEEASAAAELAAAQPDADDDSATKKVLITFALAMGLAMSLKKKEEETVDVVLVGMGMPKKGMGWYHLTQLLKMPQANVIGVVEPFFLNPDLCKNPPPELTNFVSATSSVQFCKSIDELPEFSKDTVCLIAGRTGDNPKFFEQCVSKGAKAIFLEKPGAPTVAKLEEMKKLANSKGVKVYLGYNKNVTPYVQKALKLSSEVPGSTVLFRHNNSYKIEELPECFARNSEGMLKNMAIHELALLASFFDVTTDTIDAFVIDTEVSEKLTLNPGKWLPSQKEITDFSKIKFTVTTKSNKSVSVMADRCGGNVSYASVLDARGQEISKFEFPDPANIEKVNAQVAADPDMMPYFFVQSDDYWTLKTRVLDSMIKGEDAEGLATIDVGIEAMKLAEYGTAQLMKAL
mmetsp:Transcript_15570/g.22992  ORF Transcript_15570/g.22992 Transcript_15570/m.22992 type:complete len:439 (-) Transcript_15570:257-1573(-)